MPPTITGRVWISYTGVTLHGGGHTHQRIARHDGVRIQRDHMVVGTTEAAHPVAHIPRLALGIGMAAAVENTLRPTRAGAQGQKSGLFLHPHIRVGRIGKNEQVERGKLACLLKACVNGLQPAMTRSGGSL